MTQRRGGKSTSKGGARSAPRHAPRRFPRVARVNEAMREVIAEELERIGDDRLDMVTVTGISVDPDFGNATVWYSALTGPAGIEGARAGLLEHRIALQAAVARQLRLKRTPLLQFSADPAILEGQRIEDVIRTMPRSPDDIDYGIDDDLDEVEASEDESDGREDSGDELNDDRSYEGVDGQVDDDDRH